MELSFSTLILLLLAVTLAVGFSAAIWLTGKWAFFLPDPLRFDRELDFVPTSQPAEDASTRVAREENSRAGHQTLEPAKARLTLRPEH